MEVSTVRMFIALHSYFPSSQSPGCVRGAHQGYISYRSRQSELVSVLCGPVFLNLYSCLGEEPIR